MVVRNPYKRVVSIYDNKFKNFNPNLQPIQLIHNVFLNHLYKEKNINDLDIPKILNSISFDEFLNALKIVNKLDVHTVPQSNLIKSYYLKKRNLRIIKIEDKVELNSFFEELNLTLPHRNKSKSKNSIVLDEDQKLKIYDIYKKDFQAFNYQN
jgi:hypothetical protein